MPCAASIKIKPDSRGDKRGHDESEYLAGGMMRAGQHQERHRPGSLCLDIVGADELTPLVGVVRNELAEVGG